MNLIKNRRPDIDKIYLYVEDTFDQSQMLVNGREKVGNKKLKDLEAYIDYSQTFDDVYGTLED